MCDLARDMNRAMRVVEKRTTEDFSVVQKQISLAGLRKRA